MSSKKAKLSEPELELAKALARYDHPRMFGTSSGTATDIPLVPIVHPSSATRPSPTSALAVGSSKASANHEIEEALEQVDPRVQEVFEKSVFVEKLEEIQVMNYDNLEKRTILSM